MIEERIRKIAKEHSPKECIGLIVENPETHRVRVISFDGESVSKDHSASLKAKAFLRAKKTSNILAIFHSHCHEDEHPSKIDIAYSEELKIPYYIYSTKTDKFYCYKPHGITLPYLERPFANNILDCLTLIQDFYKGETGIEVFPDFIDRSGKWWKKGIDLFIDNMPWEKLEKVTDNKLKKYDTLFFAMGDGNDIVNHCGVYLGQGRFMHHMIYQLSTETDLADHMKDLKLVVRLNELV